MERAEGRRLRRASGVSAPSAVEAEFSAPVVIAERGRSFGLRDQDARCPIGLAQGHLRLKMPDAKRIRY